MPDSDSLWQAALSAWETGDVAETERNLASLLSCFPNHIHGCHLDGVVKMAKGDAEAAMHRFRQVIQADPNNGQALSNLGNALLEAGDLAAAEEALNAGLAVDATNPLLHFNLGVVLSATHRPDDAEAAFLHASALDPTDQETWLRLGDLRYTRFDHAGAAIAYQHAAEITGEGTATAMRLAGFALADDGRPAEAERWLTRYFAQAPADVEDLPALSQLLYCRLELCDWREVADLAARCKRLLAKGHTPVEPFTFLLLAEIDAAEQLALTATFARRSLLKQPPRAHDVSGAETNRRLRIGYLCEMLHDHATAYLLAGVLEHHDHEKFEIHAFSYGLPDAGAMRRRVMNACDHFHDVALLRNTALVERIRAEKIDILIDLNGWTGNTRSAVLAHRPAPIQVNWLGYPGTLGDHRFADYLIGDPVVTPLAHQPFYAEKLVLMPHCYQPNDRTRAIAAIPRRQEVGLPEDVFVFCCFNRSLKISAQIFSGWCDLLNEAPNSVLWLLSGNPIAMHNLSAAAKQQGIDAKRLIFAPPLPHAEHLARLSLAELVLDTYPYGAHTTASDALWAGVPVLTWMGDTFPSRVAASLLTAVGLPEFIVANFADYRRLALDLARAPERLADFRRRLQENRLNYPLFDTVRFTRDFEVVLRSMWKRDCTDGTR